MSQQLYSFNDEGNIIFHKIDRNNKYNKDVKKSVICIIGQARMGKSSYLNCFNTYITKNNNEIFKSLKGDEHCTKNVQVYENEKFIFIDCQGLKYENSYNDDKILLIAYSLADIVIVNGIKTLDNTLLSLIEPISIFKNYLTKSKPRDVKPILCFKIMDYQDGFDINKQLKKLINYDIVDNYSTLRTTLRLLFNDNIIATFTNAPDRSEVKLFDNKDYKSILEIDELNFRSSIKQIIKSIDSYHKITFDEFLIKAKNVYEDIKNGINNDSFNMKEADLSKLILQRNYMSFISDIKGANSKYNSVINTFKNRNPTGTEQEYIDIVSPEIQNICKVIKKAQSNFEDGDPNIIITLDKQLFEYMESTITPFLENRKNIMMRKYESINIQHIINNYMDMYNEKIKKYNTIKSYDEIDFNKHVVEKIRDCLDSNLQKFMYDDDVLEYMNIKKYFENMNLNSKTMTKVLEMKIKVSDDILAETIQLSNMYSKFITLATFDINTIINEYIESFDKVSNMLKYMHQDNINSLNNCSTRINNIIKYETSDKNIIKYINDNKDNYDIEQSYESNVIKSYKKYLQDRIENIDQKENIINILTNIETSQKISKCNVTITNNKYIHKSKNKFMDIVNVFKKMLPFNKDYNLWEEKYNKIEFNKLFDKVEYIYNEIIFELIVKTIHSSNKIDNINNVIQNNQSFEFVRFNSENIYNTILNEYCIKSSNILIIHDPYNNTIEFCNRKYNLETIIKYFGTKVDNCYNINFNKIQTPESREQFIRYYLQDEICQYINQSMVEHTRPSLNIKDNSFKLVNKIYKKNTIIY